MLTMMRVAVAKQDNTCRTTASGVEFGSMPRSGNGSVDPEMLKSTTEAHQKNTTLQPGHPKTLPGVPELVEAKIDKIYRKSPCLGGSKCGHLQFCIPSASVRPKILWQKQKLCLAPAESAKAQEDFGDEKGLFRNGIVQWGLAHQNSKFSWKMRINHSILGYLGVPIFRQTQIAIFMGKTT
jgi:hypothetical protein